MNKPAKILLGTVALLSGYVALYLVNSLAGGYWLQPVRDGKHLMPLTGFSAHDAVQWQPRLGYVEKYQKDRMGTFFYPLLRMDQCFWHRTRYVSNTDDFYWITRTMPSSKVHPAFRAEFIKARESNSERHQYNIGESE